MDLLVIVFGFACKIMGLKGYRHKINVKDTVMLRIDKVGGQPNSPKFAA
jgi:hypothetical protein